MSGSKVSPPHVNSTLGLAARRYFTKLRQVVLLLPLLIQPSMLAQDSSIFASRINAAFTRGDYVEMESLAKQALRASGNNRIERCSFYNSLGLALRRQDRIQEAIQAYESCIDINDRYSPVHNGLGNAKADLGRLQEALGHYEDAIIRDPTYVYPYFNKGLIFERLGQLPEAIDTYSNAIDYSSKDIPRFYARLAAVQSKERRFDDAIVTFEELLEVLGNENGSLQLRAWANTGIGYSYERISQLDNAERYYQRALSIDPDYETAQEGLERLTKPTPPSNSIDTSQGLDESTLRSIVKINAELTGGPESGTGWVVKSDDRRLWIITACHVVAENIPKNSNESSSDSHDEFQASLSEEKPLLKGEVELEFYPVDTGSVTSSIMQVEVIEADCSENVDIAIIEVGNAPEGIRQLRLASTQPKVRDKVFAIGHPVNEADGRSWSTRDGQISAPEIGGPVLQFDLDVARRGISYGYSGSPLFNESVEVVGVVVRKTRDPYRASAHSVTFIRSKLREWGII